MADTSSARSSVRGHSYSNDETMEFCATVYSYQEAHLWVKQWARDHRGVQFDAAAARRLFDNAGLIALAIRPAMTVSPLVDWNEVAEEFHSVLSFVSTATRTPLTVKVPAPVPVILPADVSSDVGDVGDAGAGTTRLISADVLIVLRESSATVEAIFLPSARIEPKLYKRVNDVLVALGGSWNRKLEGHRFAEDPREVLAAVQATGAYFNAKDFGFFPTPRALAEEAVALLGLLPGMKVLEPEAGTGALADVAAEFVGTGNVDTVELLQMNVDVLKQKGFPLVGRDFLSMTPQPIYDAILMNPPFGNQMDMKHVQHAARFLKPDGRLVAIVSPSFRHRTTQVAESFRYLLAAAGQEESDIEAGTFRKSGTELATVLISMDACRMPWNLAQSDVETTETAEQFPRSRA